MYAHRLDRLQNDPHIQNTLHHAGFFNPIKIADTLQGSVWKGNKVGEATKVIKVTNKYLHHHSISKTTNNIKSHKIYENILNEQSILEYLSKQSSLPQSIIKYYDAFESANHYYLVMEHGGRSLFQFILKAHKLIMNGTVDISEWRKVVKIIFTQMIESITYIHSKNICHFDLSLENFLINDVEIYETKDSLTQKPKVHFVLEHIQCKLCDFGLSEYFESNAFLSNKYCGKINYQSPEINEGKAKFNAMSNDIWCVGICLFMMICGIMPWIKAHKTDEIFKLMMDGQIQHVLKIWKKADYVNDEWMNLMCSFFQYEDTRICLQEIKDHSWLNCV